MKYLKSFNRLVQESSTSEQELSKSEYLELAKKLIDESEDGYVKKFRGLGPEHTEQILFEFSQQLRDNFELTSSCLGEELTDIVVKLFPNYSEY